MAQQAQSRPDIAQSASALTSTLLTPLSTSLSLPSHSAQHLPKPKICTSYHLLTNTALLFLHAATSFACFSCVAIIDANRGVCATRCVKEDVGGSVTSWRARSCEASVRYVGASERTSASFSGSEGVSSSSSGEFGVKRSGLCASASRQSISSYVNINGLFVRSRSNCSTVRDFDANWPRAFWSLCRRREAVRPSFDFPVEVLPPLKRYSMRWRRYSRRSSVWTRSSSGGSAVMMKTEETKLMRWTRVLGFSWFFLYDLLRQCLS